VARSPQITRELPINEASLMAEAIVTMRVGIIWVASARTDGKSRALVHLVHFGQTVRLSGVNYTECNKGPLNVSLYTKTLDHNLYYIFKFSM
jgi:hypothetical protein